MYPYSLYPLTDHRAVTRHTGLAWELSIAAYKAVEAIAAVWDWIDRKHKRDRSIRELSRLSDCMLKDIGVSRHEIHEAVDGVLDAPVAHQNAWPRAQSARPAPKMELPVADNDNKHQRHLNAII